MPGTDPHSPPSAPPPPEQLAHWVRLTLTPGVGPVRGRLLLAHFHHPDAIFAASPPRLGALVGAAVAQALLAPVPAVLRQLEAALAWAGQPGNSIISLHDARYPPALAHIADAPLLLYASGRAALLRGPCLGVVGSRNASVQGKTNAEVMAQALSMAGLTIVSGLALGIDTAAHVGALEGAGSTVAVVGTGPDLVYPARNRALWQRIVEQGCVVSEYAPGTPPLAHNFPQRNRIISGLSLGVLVVEAAAQSGSLITARLAASQGREVLAIPGSIHSALAKGCHLLIREGARLVESAADVLQEIHGSPIARLGAHEPTREAPGAHPQLLAAIAHGPLDVETLAHACARAPHEMAVALLELELAGQLERLADGRYQRVLRP
ncbi:DNA-processing protein DprA [Massilia sp. DWR3-1-1]|uniref:DNA-processing protein DprA n=1 Tax=Massilia sp. DWR3-1-1 TaxID=2804559 RepID=UPI003CF3BB00